MMGCISSANNQPGTGHALFVCCVQTTCAMCRASTNLNKRRFRATYSSNGWARGRRSNDPGSGPPILQPRLRREVKTVKSRVRDRRPTGTEKRLRESAKVLHVVGIRCRAQRLVLIDRLDKSSQENSALRVDLCWLSGLCTTCSRRSRGAICGFEEPVSFLSSITSRRSAQRSSRLA